MFNNVYKDIIIPSADRHVLPESSLNETCFVVIFSRYDSFFVSWDINLTQK